MAKRAFRHSTWPPIDDSSQTTTNLSVQPYNVQYEKQCVSSARYSPYVCVWFTTISMCQCFVWVSVCEYHIVQYSTQYYTLTLIRYFEFSVYFSYIRKQWHFVYEKHSKVMLNSAFRLPNVTHIRFVLHSLCVFSFRVIDFWFVFRSAVCIPFILLLRRHTFPDGLHIALIPITQLN